MENVVVIEDINKHLGRRQILNKVSLSVKQGDIFGYLGPNGAGKTTTIRIIMGLMAANSGRATVLGENCGTVGARRHIGFVLEADGLYDSLTARENLIYYARLYGVREISDKVDRVLKMVGLEGRAKDKVGTYSKGMRQRLALARAMVPDPQVLVLDEPTAGVDPTGQIDIRQLMLDIVRERKMTILLSSHNLDEVQRICNRVALIHQGKIKLYGELDKLQKEMGHGGSRDRYCRTRVAGNYRRLQKMPGVVFREQRVRLCPVRG